MLRPSAMEKRVGLVVGHEPQFVEAFFSRLALEPGLEGELVSIGGTSERHIGHHDVIVDRLSDRVPHYRSYLKAEAIAGARIVNDPFRTSSQDAFFALSLAARLGARVPRTMLLPQKSYGPDVVPERELGNLEFPLRWESIAHYVGFPALVRAARDGHVLGNVQELNGLFSAFDHAGENVLMLQREVRGRAFHALVAGESVVIVGAGALSPVVVVEASRTALVVAKGLGYTLCAVHFVAAGDEASVVAAADPFPVLDPSKLGDGFATLIDGLVTAVAVVARQPAVCWSPSPA